MPDLAARGRRDGSDYAAMARRGELRTYPGRVVPVGEFVTDVEAGLSGASVFVAVADGYKAAELQDVSAWPLETVRSGSGPDGSQAVRAFQRAILTRAVRAGVEPLPGLCDSGIDNQARRERQSRDRPGAGPRSDRRVVGGGPGDRRGGALAGAGADGCLHP